MKHPKLSLILVIMLASSGMIFGNPAKEAEKGQKTIQPTEVYMICRTLASKEFSGRMTGHIGYTKAARWVANQFRDWGLQPVGWREGYLQPYPSPYSIVSRAEMKAIFPDQGEKIAGNGETQSPKEIQLQVAKDFMPLFFCDHGRKRGPLVFVGWGIHAPELGYDDYASVDVRGKFVLCFRGVPDSIDRRFQPYDEHRLRMKTAHERGAMGLVYIYPEVQAHPNGDRINGFMPVMISQEFADTILKERGILCVDLKKTLQSVKTPMSFDLQTEIDLQVDANYFPEGIGYNVIGWLEGSDVNLRHETIVLGAHFDGQGEHLGMVFPGANDNASGSAVVMTIAHAFASLKRKPKRSLLFVLFGGEEMGLMGSNYFSAHTPAAAKKISLMVNFDMEGEGDRAYASLSPDPPELKSCLEKADSSFKILADTWIMEAPGVRGSDFAPFFLKGIPCASFFSNGPHLSYHLPGDSIYRINPDIMADIAKLGFMLSYLWADR